MLANQQQQFFCSATTISSNNSSGSPITNAKINHHPNKVGSGFCNIAAVPEVARNDSFFAAYHQYHHQHNQNFLSPTFQHEQKVFRQHPHIGLITCGSVPNLPGNAVGSASIATPSPHYPFQQVPSNPQLETFQALIGIPHLHHHHEQPTTAFSSGSQQTSSATVISNRNPQEPPPSTLYRNYVNVVVYQHQQPNMLNGSSSPGRVGMPQTHPNPILPMMVQQQIC